MIAIVKPDNDEDEDDEDEDEDEDGEGDEDEPFGGDDDEEEVEEEDFFMGTADEVVNRKHGPADETVGVVESKDDDGDGKAVECEEAHPTAEGDVVFLFFQNIN